jgi:hypothetical protein
LSDLERELTSLLNRYCAESVSDTPDFILANFVLESLKVFNETTRRRDQWWGFVPEIGNPHIKVDDD